MMVARLMAKTRVLILTPRVWKVCSLKARPLCEAALLKIQRVKAMSLQRYRYGPGAFNIDWALKGPVPWKATEYFHAATVHLGGSFEELSASQSAPWRGQPC